MESRFNKPKSLTKIVPVVAHFKLIETDAGRLAALSFPGTCTVSHHQPPHITGAATITISDLKVSPIRYRASYIEVLQYFGSFEITPWRRKKLCLREPVQLISAHCVE